jgi:hypothetical protein
MTTRREYIEKLKTKLDEWDADIDELEANALKTKADLKYELEDQIASLKIKRDIARAKLLELMDSGEDAWQDIKDGVDEAWNSLKLAIEKARSHFQ